MPFQAVAQDFSGEICRAPLAKDYLSFISSDAEQYAFLSFIDKSTFEEIKNKGDIKVGVDIPIISSLINAYSDWDDYKQRREALFSKVEYKSDISHEQKILKSVTSDRAYNSFDTCIAAVALSRSPGLTLWKTREGKDFIVIRWYFSAPPGVSEEKITSSLTGGFVDGVPAGLITVPDTKILSGGYGSALIKRDVGSPVFGTLQAGAYLPTDFQSEWYPSVPSADGTATISISYSDNPEVVIPREQTKVVPDNHNERCKGGTCSPDGKWRASTTTFEITANPGRLLRNPVIVCMGWPSDFRSKLSAAGPLFSAMLKDGTDACAFSANISDPVVHNGNRATAVISTFSRPIEFTLKVEEYSENKKPDSSKTIKIFKDKTFSLMVPNYPNNAVINIKLNGEDFVLSPGASLPAKNINLVGEPLKSGNNTYYMYMISGN